MAMNQPERASRPTEAAPAHTPRAREPTSARTTWRDRPTASTWRALTNIDSPREVQVEVEHVRTAGQQRRRVGGYDDGVPRGQGGDRCDDALFGFGIEVR